MIRKEPPDTLKTRADAVACFYRETGRMPSFSKLGELVGFKSKYPPIRPKNELKIAGVVTSVVRQYK